MAVFSTVEVLEDGLKVDAADLDGLAVLIKDSANLLFSAASLEVLAAGEQSVILSNGWDADGRGLVNAGGGECLVNASDESDVVEETLGVISLVPCSKRVILFSCEVEIKLGKDRVELVLSHVTLSQFVEVEEELFDTDTLHHN